MVEEPEYKGTWGIEVTGNISIADRDSILGCYRHFRFWEDWDDFNDTTRGCVILGSDHVNVLCEDDAHRAVKRMEALLILFNGIEATFGRITRKNNMNGIYHYKENHTITAYSNLNPINQDEKLKYYSDDGDFNVFMEELNNPFDESVLEYFNYKYPDIAETEEGFMMEMATKDEISRTILIWRSLCEGDNIHFITNAYKIYDTVHYFLNKDNKYKENRENHLMQELVKQYDVMCENTHFMNTYKYAGLLARHGHTKFRAPSDANPKESFKKLKSNLNDLVLSWFKYKHNQYLVDRINQCSKQNMKKSGDTEHFFKTVTKTLNSMLELDDKK